MNPIVTATKNGCKEPEVYFIFKVKDGNLYSYNGTSWDLITENKRNLNCNGMKLYYNKAEAKQEVERLVKKGQMELTTKGEFIFLSGGISIAR